MPALSSNPAAIVLVAPQARGFASLLFSRFAFVERYLTTIILHLFPVNAIGLESHSLGHHNTDQWTIYPGAGKLGPFPEQSLTTEATLMKGRGAP